MVKVIYLSDQTKERIIMVLQDNLLVVSITQVITTPNLITMIIIQYLKFK